MIERNHPVSFHYSQRTTWRNPYIHRIHRHLDVKEHDGEKARWIMCSDTIEPLLVAFGIAFDSCERGTKSHLLVELRSPGLFTGLIRHTHTQCNNAREEDFLNKNSCTCSVTDNSDRGV